MNIIISGGGTGGHIYPAIAIANTLKGKMPDCNILFVGAKGKMEMEKVPKAGYEIEGLDIVGIQRKLTLKNLLVPFKLAKSMYRAGQIIKKFKPDVAVGVGGYASGPLLKMAGVKGVPYLIQEQNSHAGITNKILSKKAKRICVAYDGMDKFFPKEKILFTGNPVRKDITELEDKKHIAIKHFNLDSDKKTILVFGGSLGAKTLSDAVADGFDRTDVNLIWQVGSLYFEKYKNSEVANMPNVKILSFIDRMDLAYAAADIAVTRAGALTISELSIVGMPSIMVPFPYASEDHQTRNAMALVEKNAGMIIPDNEAADNLIDAMNKLVDDVDMQVNISEELKFFAKPDAANQIAEEVIRLC